jgi:hypothetical protein
MAIRKRHDWIARREAGPAHRLPIPEIESVAEHWLALRQAAADDPEAAMFEAGTFGPWAAGVIETVSH